MGTFVDEMAEFILAKEKPNIEKVLNEVTENIRKDFAIETYRLIDKYYETYEPMYYVRLYNRNGRGSKRTLGRSKGGVTKSSPRGKNKAGHANGLSLHSAITKGGENHPLIGVAGGNYVDGFVAGVVFDESYFKNDNMRHIDKGDNFSEWNIVENFLFAGEGGYGDWRSDPRSGYSELPADQELDTYMDNYYNTLYKHFENAKNKIK